MLFTPFVFYTLSELETKIVNFKNQTNGSKTPIYMWRIYRQKHMPLILKSKYCIKLDIKESRSSENEIYVGTLEPFGKLFYSIENKQKESIAIFNIYGAILIENGNINTKLFSPAADMFLLKNSLVELVNKIIEKGESLFTLSKFLLNLYEHINGLDYREFINFCNINNLKNVVINKDDFDILTPLNFLKENNYKDFDVVLYISLLFWLFSTGDIEIKIID